MGVRRLVLGVLQCHIHTCVYTNENTQIVFGDFQQTKNGELVYWLQMNRIRKERLESP